jgi:nitroreductase
MQAHRLRALILAAVIAIVAPMTAAAQELKPIQLPQPKTSGGRPLMDVFNARKSVREFGTEPLSLQVLSNLLWAGFGINRTDGRRTAPSARNWQEIDIYVARQDGVYVYEAKANVLNPVLAGDHRGETGTQPYVSTAAINLIYIADMTRTGKAPAEERDLFTPANAGFIGENVYLFCASEGLSTVVRGLVDREALAKLLRLRPEQRIVLAQSVGYPKK